MNGLQCFWCGSTDTRFLHYACWEEDRVGNPIEVQSLDSTEGTPRDEVHYCDHCEGSFAFPVEPHEGGESGSEQE